MDANSMPSEATRARSRAATATARFGGALVLATFLGCALAVPAGAEVSGGCTGSVNGQDVGGRSSTDPAQAIQVQWNSSVPVVVKAPAPITGYHVDMEYAGVRFTVANGASNGNSWSSNVAVDQYSKYGVGLYKVIGSSTGPGACDAAFLIGVVGKDPLSTPAGAAAAAILAIGAVTTVAATAAGAMRPPASAAGYLRDLNMIDKGQLAYSAVYPYIVDPGGVTGIV